MRKYSLNEAIKRKKIIPFANGPRLVSKEIEAAKEDLKDAEDLFSRGRFKSATTAEESIQLTKKIL